MKVTTKRTRTHTFGELKKGDVFLLPLTECKNDDKICIKIGEVNKECGCCLDIQTGDLHNISPDCCVEKIDAELTIYKSPKA